MWGRGNLDSQVSVEYKKWSKIHIITDLDLYKKKDLKEYNTMEIPYVNKVEGKPETFLSTMRIPNSVIHRLISSKRNPETN